MALFCVKLSCLTYQSDYSRSNYYLAICRQGVTLVAGDTIVLLLFAAIGRKNHGESLDATALLATAWPFLVGQSGCGWLLQGFKQPRGPREAALTAAKCWAPAVLVCALHIPRCLQRGLFINRMLCAGGPCTAVCCARLPSRQSFCHRKLCRDICPACGLADGVCGALTSAGDG